MFCCGSRRNTSEKPCIFCNVSDTIGITRIVAETEHLVAFRDRSPSAKVHLLVIPKEHISTVKDLSREHMPLLHEMVELGKRLLKEEGFDPENEDQIRYWTWFSCTTF
ncbi:hypothetical protein RO3G_00067 [Rhizopus delemar RA 99-880]|uniref:HIT domain-containing protein n=1 Tax=Rhizopus delemar (strain RA 99-880 / ATCC MYA-4621 / FGSC 9543 / NRRL 43880) TaxID=246409 RepID=I1BGN3_RHIO9|nr:hypothetical protein RO3G_00067 [Rhizopus delemar RA 99-880]|eukprot:EIE75363.1 hypothetical protein RO3G_00067 [Rhizopus delemar RA 99-880]